MAKTNDGTSKRVISPIGIAYLVVFSLIGLSYFPYSVRHGGIAPYAWCPVLNFGSCTIPAAWKDDALRGANRAKIYQILGKSSGANPELDFAENWAQAQDEDWTLVVRFQPPASAPSADQALALGAHIVRRDLRDNVLRFQLW